MSIYTIIIIIEAFILGALTVGLIVLCLTLQKKSRHGAYKSLATSVRKRSAAPMKRRSTASRAKKPTANKQRKPARKSTAPPKVSKAVKKK